MPKTDVQFLEDRLSMMETEGWRDFIEDFKNLENSASNIDTMNSEQDLWHAKGQLLMINLVLSLQSATNLALEESVDQTPT
jgi:hypothetical protein